MIGESRPACHPVFHKTALCKFNALGKCTRGKACKFAHDEEELQPTPDFRFTKLCPEFRRAGWCQKGNACAFAHNAKEVQSRRSGGARAPHQAVPASRDERGGARPAPAGRAVEAKATRMLLSRCVEAPLPPPPPDLIVARAVPVQMVQVVPVVCMPMPAAAAPSCSFGGFGGRVGMWETVKCPEQSATEDVLVSKEAPNTLSSKEMSNLNDDADFPDDDFDASCEKDQDLDLDLPDNSWSRQSTAESDLFEPPTEFGRQSTMEPWPAVEEEDEEELSEEERHDGTVEDDAKRGLSDTLAPPERAVPSFPQLAMQLGMSFGVQNTFIRFVDQEPLGATLRRMNSTGSLQLAV